MIGREPERHRRPDERVDYWIRMPRDAQAYAKKLYAALREQSARELVALAQAGDRQAFGELALRLQPTHKFHFWLWTKKHAEGTHVSEIIVRWWDFRFPLWLAACASTENNGREYEKWTPSHYAGCAYGIGRGLEAEHHNHKRPATSVPLRTDY